jgi:hypothetical protein
MAFNMHSNLQSSAVQPPSHIPDFKMLHITSENSATHLPCANRSASKAVTGSPISTFENGDSELQITPNIYIQISYTAHSLAYFIKCNSIVQEKLSGFLSGERPVKFGADTPGSAVVRVGFTYLLLFTSSKVSKTLIPPTRESLDDFRCTSCNM